MGEWLSTTGLLTCCLWYRWQKNQNDIGRVLILYGLWYNQLYRDLWGMINIKAEQAWITTTGSPSIIIAGIDTGVDRNHEDLAANMWTNSGETPNTRTTRNVG